MTPLGLSPLTSSSSHRLKASVQPLQLDVVRVAGSLCSAKSEEQGEIDAEHQAPILTGCSGLIPSRPGGTGSQLRNKVE